MISIHICMVQLSVTHTKGKAKRCILGSIKSDPWNGVIQSNWTYDVLAYLLSLYETHIIFIYNIYCTVFILINSVRKYTSTLMPAGEGQLNPQDMSTCRLVDPRGLGPVSRSTVNSRERMPASRITGIGGHIVLSNGPLVTHRGQDSIKF